MALFVPDLRAGGAERVMVRLAAGLAERGHPVDLVVGRATGDYVREVPDSVRLVELGASRVVTALPRLTRYLLRARPRALLSTMNHVNVACILAARLTGTRVVVREASNVAGQMRDATQARARLVPWAMRITYPHADMVVACSRAAAADVAHHARLPESQVRVIENPLDLARVERLARAPAEHPWLATPGLDPVVVGVGRLVPEKDFDVLIRGVARARATSPLRLIILGEGVERPRLERLVTELGLEDVVSLPGFQSNPFAFMARAAVVALTSRWEGSPNVVIQGLALRRRVLATDAPGGARATLEDGRLGWLVPVGDERAVGAALVEALESETWTTPGPAWFRRFDAAEVVRLWAEALRLE